MALQHITPEELVEHGVVSAPNILDGSAQDNKKTFDRLVAEVVAPHLNAAVDVVNQMETEQVDWRGDEAARKRNEEGRVGAEQARETAETARESAEAIRRENEQNRVSQEQDRRTGETDRAAAEQDRRNSEGTRVRTEEQRKQAEQERETQESLRQTGETARESAEGGRRTAENQRASAEESRGNAETARASAEDGRVLAEAQRVQREEDRVRGENSRDNAETARGRAEQEREAAEAQRVRQEEDRVRGENSRGNKETAREQAEQERATAEAQRVRQEEERVRADADRVKIDDGAISDKKTYSSQKIERLSASKVDTADLPAATTDMTQDVGWDSKTKKLLTKPGGGAPDWLVNDPGQPGHITNRPCYTGDNATFTPECHETTVQKIPEYVSENTTALRMPLPHGLIPGELYRVTIDGQAYYEVAEADQYEPRKIASIGDKYGVFYIEASYSEDGSSNARAYVKGTGTCTLSIDLVTPDYHTLDANYIPSVQRTEHIIFFTIKLPAPGESARIEGQAGVHRKMLTQFDRIAKLFDQTAFASAVMRAYFAGDHSPTYMTLQRASYGGMSNTLTFIDPRDGSEVDVRYSWYPDVIEITHRMPSVGNLPTVTAAQAGQFAVVSEAGEWTVKAIESAAEVAL